MSGKYDPVVAPTVVEGIYRMKQMEFAAVIVDIRLLPGNDSDWESLYLKLGMKRGHHVLAYVCFTASSILVSMT